jgi:subtilisin family serine protease
MSGVIAGLDWVAQNHPVNTPAVVNMSLGGGANSSLDTAVNALINRGITVVVAAGNSSADACNYSPARVPGAITVAATTSTDGFATYSNFGSCVDIAAPGTSITAAWFGSDSETRTISGTSMATPHVAGVVARQLALGNQLPAAISSALANAASKNKISGLPSATSNLLLFASATDSAEQPVAVTPPAAASGLVAEGSVKLAKLSWVLGENSANPLTGQTVRLWANNQLVKTYNVGTSTTTITPTKLRGGVSYYFTVLAISSTGVTESARSNSVLVTNK